jgi:hypothetical protein
VGSVAQAQKCIQVFARKLTAGNHLEDRSNWEENTSLQFTLEKQRGKVAD